MNVNFLDDKNVAENYDLLLIVNNFIRKNIQKTLKKKKITVYF